jgi:hypothetical protein
MPRGDSTIEPGRVGSRQVHQTGLGGHASMWALTSYYNPVRYRRRRENYRAFRRHLDLPLITVEMEPDGRFELVPGDANILVQIPCGDVMWQKERLLNVALNVVPAACRKIAWIDCDVIFTTANWVERASDLLDVYPLVQLFGAVHYLPPNADPTDIGGVGPELTRPSIAQAVASGSPDPGRGLDEGGVNGMGALASGFAWAARRDLLERHRFYDACIIGGGDTAMVAAALGSPERAISRLAMTESQTRHYLPWARSFGLDVAGNVSAVGANIYHLWHGALANRRRRVRNQELATFGFDPFLDIEAASDGAWCWASNKPAMHRFLRDYFLSRREDG